jgi:hypothetical protein
VNQSDARATLTDNGYVGEFRLSWKPDYFTVNEWCPKQSAMVPRNFKSPIVAELYAWREKHQQEERAMRRDGETIHISNADAHFKLNPFVKAKGSQKRTVVERKDNKGKEISVERAGA